MVMVTAMALSTDQPIPLSDPDSRKVEQPRTESRTFLQQMEFGIRAFHAIFLFVLQMKLKRICCIDGETLGRW